MVEEPLYCLVEIPRGSRNKYEWDAALGAIKLDRFLFTSMVYPTDYGFIPETCGEDGDPLDALVLVSAPTFPGCMIAVRAVGLFRMADEEGRDDKVLCVPHDDPGWEGVDGVDDVPEQLRDEIRHFFSVYKQLEPKEVSVEGFEDRDAALAVIDEARKRWRARAQ